MTSHVHFVTRAPRLKKARFWRTARHLAGQAVVNGLLGLGAMVFIALGTGGFSLVKTARIWGSFWVHFANADAGARAPIHSAAVSLWLFLTVCIWAYRRISKGAEA